MSELFNIERVLGFCEKVCYILVVNLLFVLSNIPVLLFLLFVGAGQIRQCLPLFLFSMLPMTLSLPAVFYTMNRLIQGTEGKGLRDFKKGYCADFVQKLKLGFGHLLVILILWTNVEFFALQVRILPLTIIFGILLAISLLVTPNLYMLISRYQMKNMEIVRTAVTILIARPVATLGNIVALAIVLMAFEISPGTTVLFMGSVYGFLIMFMNQRMLRKLEER